MAKTRNNYTTKTIASWDEAAPRHAAINAKLATDVADPNFNTEPFEESDGLDSSQREKIFTNGTLV